MERENDDFMRYNLLAICQSPLLTIARQLSASLVTANILEEIYGDTESWDVHSPWAIFPNHRLARFDLTREQIIAESSLSGFPEDQPGIASVDLAAAKATAQRLHDEQKQLERQYVMEEATIAEAVEKFRMRGEDYTPAIHHWVRILAEKGVLRQLLQDMDDLS
jgi:ubiquitin carboxyl-terminal hydrolase L5